MLVAQVGEQEAAVARQPRAAQRVVQQKGQQRRAARLPHAGRLRAGGRRVRGRLRRVPPERHRSARRPLLAA